MRFKIKHIFLLLLTIIWIYTVYYVIQIDNPFVTSQPNGKQLIIGLFFVLGIISLLLLILFFIINNLNKIEDFFNKEFKL